MRFLSLILKGNNVAIYSIYNFFTQRKGKVKIIFVQEHIPLQLYFSSHRTGQKKTLLDMLMHLMFVYSLFIIKNIWGWLRLD